MIFRIGSFELVYSQLHSLGERFRKKGVHVGRVPHMHTFFAYFSLRRLQPEQLRLFSISQEGLK